MKSLLEHNNDLLSTTTKEKNKLQFKDYLFSHVDKLAADHDVILSNTMIKITYKKALKDQNAVDSAVDCVPDSDFSNKKDEPTETSTLCNSDISFIVKSPKVQGGKAIVFHSTPKHPGTDPEKKKKYMNGLNLPVKHDSLNLKNIAVKVQKLHSQEDGGPSPKKPKTNSPKQMGKADSEKRFLKGNGLVKPKTSIIKKNNADAKKMKTSDKKIENRVKKKVVDKKIKKIQGVKRKGSDTELNALDKNKKVKINESKQKISEGERSLEEKSKSGKKPIMLVDPDLPAGWSRFIRIKNKGTANKQYVVYVMNSQGKKFRFKWKLRKYLQRTNSTLDADQFFFGLYQRPKTLTSSSVDIHGEKSKSVSDKKSEGDVDGTDSESSREPENRIGGHDDDLSDPKESSDGREILLYDPDLPFGWKRIIHSNSSNGRKQVHIISPDGKIFRRRYRLHEYLIKHQYTHNLDRFYFGLYPKKEGNAPENSAKEPEVYRTDGSAVIYDKIMNYESENGSGEYNDNLKFENPDSPMYDDPNLPEGWKRFIQIRSCGGSAGRMEVVIVSPDGRRHRTKKHLEQYLVQKQLNYKAEDFDFTVFGRSCLRKCLPSTSALEQEPERETNEMTFFGMKKKFQDKPVPELDIDSLKEAVVTPEGRLINMVKGLLNCSGLSTSRNIRRQRVSRKDHEKQLKDYLSSEKEMTYDVSQIPTHWIQRLMECRADLRVLEPDALSTIADATKDFIKNLSVQALACSDLPESGLRYEDVAEIVDRADCLSFLKTLIPKKITFKEFRRLNRPKQFMSFT